MCQCGGFHVSVLMMQNAIFFLKMLHLVDSHVTLRAEQEEIVYVILLRAIDAPRDDVMHAGGPFRQYHSTLLTAAVAFEKFLLELLPSAVVQGSLRRGSAPHRACRKIDVEILEFQSEIELGPVNSESSRKELLYR